MAALAASYGLEVFCVLHAGDGNLHPCFLYDGADDGAKKKAEAASMEVLRICADLGGTVSGEHGIGIEKLEAMHFVFTDDDLRAQALSRRPSIPGASATRGACPAGRGRSAGLGRPGDRRVPERRGCGRCLAGRSPDFPVAEERGVIALRLAGDDRVSDRVGGVPASIQGCALLLKCAPADEGQLAAVLALANAGAAGRVCRRRWYEAGLGQPAGPVRPASEHPRSLRVHLYVDADDLTLTIAAGVTVAEAAPGARGRAASCRSTPGQPGSATVGGVAATGDQGARGAGYGAVRDVVLGLRATLADGTSVKFGGGP